MCKHPTEKYLLKKAKLDFQIPNAQILTEISRAKTQKNVTSAKYKLRRNTQRNVRPFAERPLSLRKKGKRNESARTKPRPKKED